MLFFKLLCKNLNYVRISKKYHEQRENLLTNDNSFHRILNTDIKSEPNSKQDEIIFGCGCFWGAENVLETARCCYNIRRLCWWR